MLVVRLRQRVQVDADRVPALGAPCVGGLILFAFRVSGGCSELIFSSLGSSFANLEETLLGSPNQANRETPGTTTACF
jgi:hypothetical protein